MTMTLARRLWPLTLLAVLGCSSPEAPEDRPYVDPRTIPLVPVEGTVTLDGKPLAGAVVTFLPPRDAPSNGETDQNGHYVMKTYERDGVPQGEYKVAVSYLVSAEGVPQGLGPRSAQSQPPGMLTATERLKPEFADLGRTKLTATVGPQGGTFDFAVEAKPEEPKGATDADAAPGPAKESAATTSADETPSAPSEKP